MSDHSQPQNNNLGMMLIIGLLLFFVFGQSRPAPEQSTQLPKGKLMELLLGVLADQIDFDGKEKEPRLEFLSDIGELLKTFAKRALLGRLLTGQERSQMEAMAKEIDALNDGAFSQKLDSGTRSKVVSILRKFRQRLKEGKDE
tara:strand:- start:779 stop:1207 length:429 start_codon:yes stop_codon:yes gene_type:complete